MDTQTMDRERERLAEEVKRVANAAHRAAMQAPDVADQVSEAMRRMAKRAPDVTDRFSEAAHRVATQAPDAVSQASDTVIGKSDEFAGFVRRNSWFPILAAASLGLIMGVIFATKSRS